MDDNDWLADRFEEHRRHLRAQMLLGPAGSAMTRHARIQTFR